MSSPTPQVVRFHQTFDRALDFARRHLQELGGDVVLVRDLTGRISLALPGAPPPPPRLAALSQELHSQLGGFSPGAADVFVLKTALYDPGSIFASPDALPLGEGIRLLDRQVIGADWLRTPLPNTGRTPPRATFFGIKGGVGRSTALVMWARYLAQEDRRVLVLDLDLESPGLSAALLQPDARPSFGVVDWFIEDTVGQADEALLRDMVATSPLAAGTNGEIRVVPAGGTTGRYLPKLARVYAEPPMGDEGGSFGQRLAKLLDALEELERPDIVLLDSRAGIHDIAAVTVTRLGAVSFLFGVDTPQTWLAYRMLFEQWREQPRLLRGFREDLQIVAGQVPETHRLEYLKSMRRHAYDLFLENIYEEMGPDDTSAFNYDLEAAMAPHQPIPIYWRRELQDFDPLTHLAALTEEQILAAYGEFFERATELTSTPEVTS